MEWNANPLELDSPEATAILRRKARKLARLRILGDEEDVAQELALRLLRKQAHYDSSRGQPQAFLRVLADREAASWIRYARAQRRFHGGPVSLDSPVAEEGCPLAELIVDPKTAGIKFTTTDVRQDVATLVGQLSRRDRHLCRLAMRYSPSEIARITGLPRTTILSRLHRLRTKFAALRVSG